MRKYTVVLTKRAQKQLDKLTDRAVKPILQALSDLENNPRPIGSKKLNGRSGYRVRVGDYRIIYEIFDKQLVIDVIAIGDRKDIYG